MASDGDTPLYNLSGALIFSAYVMSALVFTLLICNSLWSQYQKVTKAKNHKQTVETERRLQVFSALAVLSFSTLSYHMLSYLIVSYQSWARSNNTLLPQRVVGHAGLFGFRDKMVKLHVWEWLTSSTLFHDFAMTICDDSARFWWTQQTLLLTMTWSVFMSFEGRKRNVPHLWAYAFISQILPVSFAQNLFFLAMLLKPVRHPKQPIWTPTPIVQLLPLTAYYIFVPAAPYVARTGAFISVVVLIRLLLVTPLTLPALVPEGGGLSYLTPRKARWVDGGPFQFIGICSALLWISQTFLALKTNGFNLGRIFNAVNDNPAVSALGYDYILSLASFGSWAFLVGYDLA